MERETAAPAEEEETLVEAALRVLNEPDPVEKARLGEETARRWFDGSISVAYRSDHHLPSPPDRPARLSNDIIARFGKTESMPREFLNDFVVVAQDEGRHFTLLKARLEEMGSFYGALPAHDGLWDSATQTSADLLARLAVEHCVHEARGLDVLPTTISRFRNGGDEKTANLLETTVYPEEITHCAAGIQWFRFLCLRSAENLTVDDDDKDGFVIKKFHEVVRRYFRGPLKPPFNVEARKNAGFGPEWYEPLAIKEAKIDS